MNSWPLQSAPCSKNSCQIIPFCKREKKHNWPWLGQKNAAKRTQRRHIWLASHNDTQHTNELKYTHKTPPGLFKHLQFLQRVLCSIVGGVTRMDCKSKNVAAMLSSVEPFFLWQTDVQSTICRDVVLDGDSQTEVLRMMDDLAEMVRQELEQPMIQEWHVRLL